MEQIVERYRHKKTGNGHELKVDKLNNEVLIWYLLWGEYQGNDNHHHMGLARICYDTGIYLVGWLRGIEQESYSKQPFADLEDLFLALDAEIAER
jgi:hypothetical protein